ncbi:CBO0543 family protein [Bacillus sp. B1-b2]|uniref:CBO0543 family protein n=1 Tax=Bacillus sp. B1-b2 TaxID=2653201 RepID=UPI0012627A08|nr:CBO0543 family protein [Bacillus sp. B1-b2]KAB7672065.1 hypothetical protein F9279_03845 [Bacillus sp. B1-b2]
MHLLLAIILVALTYWKGDWRNWQKYAPTIQYVIISNLLYNYFCHDFLLWEYKGDLLQEKHNIVDLVYTFIILPCITLIFLTQYPYFKAKLSQARYILYWVAGSMLVEFIMIYYKRLLLNNGFEYWMDFFFYIVMYSLIRLHHTRPIRTYFISILVIVFLLWHFQVPL